MNDRKKFVKKLAKKRLPHPRVPAERDDHNPRGQAVDHIICPACGAKVSWADRHIHPCATRHLREFKMKNLHHQISLRHGEVRY